MDFLGELIGRFKKSRLPQEPKTISQILEGKFAPKVWTSEYFREYIIALGRGEKFLLTIDQYPDLIELSKAWHVTLENMRTKTSNGHEHYSTIGFNEIQRTVNVQREPLMGNPGQISTQLQSKAETFANRAGLNRVGDIHTHPNQHNLAFSIGDLYNLVYPGNRNYIMVVLGTNDNLFAFRARNSTTTGLSGDVLTQEGFCKSWYEGNGYRFTGISEAGEKTMPISANAPSQWELNLKVAKKHGLVLYESDAKGDLVKVFPVINRAS